MSTFDPDSFLDTNVEGALSTHIVPIPEGEYQAFISDVKARQAKESRILDVHYKILDSELEKKLGREEVTVRQSMFLDFTEDGALDNSEGKNVRLGRLREAVGQNTGKRWSPRQLVGAGPVLIKVTQRVDKEDSEQIYNDVTRVATAA